MLSISRQWPLPHKLLFSFFSLFYVNIFQRDILKKIFLFSTFNMAQMEEVNFNFSLMGLTSMKCLTVTFQLKTYFN